MRSWRARANDLGVKGRGHIHDFGYQRQRRHALAGGSVCASPSCRRAEWLGLAARSLPTTDWSSAPATCPIVHPIGTAQPGSKTTKQSGRIDQNNDWPAQLRRMAADWSGATGTRRQLESQSALLRARRRPPAGSARGV